MIKDTIVTNTVLPTVSKRFYNKLITVFKPLDPMDINEDTSMISIQRNAAQQEVIKFIEQAVSKETHTELSLLDRIKYVINN